MFRNAASVKHFQELPGHGPFHDRRPAEELQPHCAKEPLAGNRLHSF